MTILKIFLIKGGTEANRKAKYYELIRSDQSLMYDSIYNADKSQVIVYFTTVHKIDPVTFEDFLKLVDETNNLGKDFTISTFGNESRNGVINMGPISSTKKLYGWYSAKYLNMSPCYIHNLSGDWVLKKPHKHIYLNVGGKEVTVTHVCDSDVPPKFSDTNFVSMVTKYVRTCK